MQSSSQSRKPLSLGNAGPYVDPPHVPASPLAPPAWARKLRELRELLGPDESAERLHTAPASLAKAWKALTPAEARVLKAFLHHPSDKIVAQRLAIKTQTVRNHIAAIEAKLGVPSREALILCLLRLWCRDCESG